MHLFIFVNEYSRLLVHSALTKAQRVILMHW